MFVKQAALENEDRISYYIIDVRSFLLFFIIRNLMSPFSSRVSRVSGSSIKRFQLPKLWGIQLECKSTKFVHLPHCFMGVREAK
jgi:hypothetical protein